MIERNFMEAKETSLEQPWWFKLKVSSLDLKAPKLTVNPAVTIQEVVTSMKVKGITQAVVASAKGYSSLLSSSRNLERLPLTTLLKLSSLSSRDFLNFTLTYSDCHSHHSLYHVIISVPFMYLYIFY